MIEPSDTIWKAEPHTRAKHEILVSYLQAWAAIMSRHHEHSRAAGQLHIIDGFAGPGVYTDGEKGSPIRALNAILEHSLEFPIPIRFDFVEYDKARFASLNEQVEALKPQLDLSDRINSVTCHHEACDRIILNWLDECDNQRKAFGPCFCFLDQFGYSHVPLELIKRIMKHRSCETFSYLGWAHMNHYITDKTKWSAISAAFGGDQWKRIFDHPRSDWPNLMPALYKESLVQLANVKYVWHMAMASQHQLSHWLFFCTNNDRGLEEMKKAMRRIDPTGEFRFADSDDPNQFSLIGSYDDTKLRNALQSKYKNCIVTVGELRMFVLTETPGVTFKKLLGSLEQEGEIWPVDPPAGRRKRDFSDLTLKLRFK